MGTGVSRRPASGATEFFDIVVRFRHRSKGTDRRLNRVRRFKSMQTDTKV